FTSRRMNSASSRVKRRNTSLSVSRTRMGSPAREPLAPATRSKRGLCRHVRPMLQAFQNAQQFARRAVPGEAPGALSSGGDLGGPQLAIVEQAIDAGGDVLDRFRV